MLKRYEQMASVRSEHFLTPNDTSKEHRRDAHTSLLRTASFSHSQRYGSVGRSPFTCRLLHRLPHFLWLHGTNAKAQYFLPILRRMRCRHVEWIPTWIPTKFPRRFDFAAMSMKFKTWHPCDLCTLCGCVDAWGAGTSCEWDF